MLYRERLAAGHHLDSFSCGHPGLDRWLRVSAVTADRSGTGRTYVWVDAGGSVVAYFTLAPHLVLRENIPTKVGRGSPDVIPAVLLARLALAEHLQGHPDRLGSVLLLDALDVAITAIRTVGGRLVVVDAIDDHAHGFYRHHGVAPVPGDTHRLVMKAGDAAQALGMGWP